MEVCEEVVDGVWTGLEQMVNSCPELSYTTQQEKDKTHTVLKSLVKKLKSYLEDWWATRNIYIFSFPDDHAL